MTRRRQLVWVVAILVVATLVVPAVAVAAPDPETSVQAPNSALTWTNVRDSDGVPLSSYMFVTSEPKIWEPLQTMLAFVLQVMFEVWLVIVTLAIWLIGFALSFGFLDVFAEILLGTANLFAGQVATTIVLITAATIGAFFVSYFVVRGFYAKATMQVVTMLAVAVFGVIFLAHPLAEVLGPDGLLAKGRDLGISIAAGLNGNSNPDPDSVVATMQASLADNFARKPLQVWNFGHVIDDQCGAAWSSGMMSGDSSQARDALGGCDRDAYWAAKQPSINQFGAGLVLLVCGLILVWFAIRLGLKVIRTAMNAVYHGFMSILGFAAGGYIYGPTQTFLIRNLVDTAFAAFGMAAYTVFLAIYVLILGDVFQQAGEQVVPVFVLGAIVMLIATRQMLNLRRSLESGGEWVANRFALATQAAGGGAGSGAAGGGDRALGMGMGPGAGSSTIRDWAPIAGLWAMNTVANAASNPMVAPLWTRGGLGKNPLARPYKWQEAMSFERENAEGVVRDLLDRRGWKPGQDVDGRMLAGLVNYWHSAKMDQRFLASSLRSVAGVGHNRLRGAAAAETNIDRNVTTSAIQPLARTWVGARNFFNSYDTHGADDPFTSNAFEAAGVAARNANYSITKPTRPLTAEGRRHFDLLENNMHSQKALYDATAAAGGREWWAGLEPNVRDHVKFNLTQQISDAHHRIREQGATAANMGEYRRLTRRLEILHDVAKAQYGAGVPL